jgi:acid phosphatase type 7
VRFPDKATGPWQLIGLNPYAGLAKGSAQLKWLDQKLKASDAPCVLAFAHPFRFSSGMHGHNDKVEPDAKIVFGSMLEEAYKVLHAHHASLLVTGHDHVFEQFGPQDVNGNASDAGVRSFVVGTGGATLYNSFRDKKKKKHRLKYNKKAPNSERYDQDSRGILKIELFANSYRWQFIPIAGDKPIDLPVTKADCSKHFGQ